MTIATEVKRVVELGTGSTSTFYFNAPVDLVDDLEVYTFDTVAGTGQKQTRGGSGTYDYTTTLNASTKYATISLNTVLPSTFRIIIVRKIAITQQVDYVEGDPFPAETHEGALDKLTLVATMLSEQIDRSLKVAITSATVSSIEISEPQANRALVWNTTADGLIAGPNASDIASAQTNAASAAQSAADAQAAEQNVISIQNQLSPGNLKISANDTTANYVELKIIQGTGIEMTTNNEGGNETRTVALDSAASAISKVQLVSNFV